MLVHVADKKRCKNMASEKSNFETIFKKNNAGTKAKCVLNRSNEQPIKMRRKSKQYLC